jgi:hypothetical protein
MDETGAEIISSQEALMKVGLAAVCLIASLAQAHADNLIYPVKNSSGHNIQVRFFSQTRTVWWPGENSGYNQAKKTTVNYNISCNPGEYICYGAWSMPDEKLNWGVGLTGKGQCSQCCNHCGDKTGGMTLHKAAK